MIMLQSVAPSISGCSSTNLRFNQLILHQCNWSQLKLKVPSIVEFNIHFLVIIPQLLFVLYFANLESFFAAILLNKYKFNLYIRTNSLYLTEYLVSKNKSTILHCYRKNIANSFNIWLDKKAYSPDESAEGNTPRKYLKKPQNSSFSACYYFALKTLLILVGPYYGTLVVLIWHEHGTL